MSAKTAVTKADKDLQDVRDAQTALRAKVKKLIQAQGNPDEDFDEESQEKLGGPMPDEPATAPPAQAKTGKKNSPTVSAAAPGAQAKKGKTNSPTVPIGPA